MKVTKKITVEFSVEEKSVIDKMYKLISDFRNTDACTALSCEYCLFEKLCGHKSNDVENIINSYLE